MSRLVKLMIIAGCLSASSCGDDPATAEEVAPVLTGIWEGTLAGQPVTFILDEEPAGAVSGDARVQISSSTGSMHFLVTGRHEYPALTLELILWCAFCPATQWTFEASVSEDRLEGTLFRYNLPDEVLIMTR